MGIEVDELNDYFYFLLGGQIWAAFCKLLRWAQKDLAPVASAEVVSLINQPSAGFSSFPVLLALCISATAWNTFQLNYKPLLHSAFGGT